MEFRTAPKHILQTLAVLALALHLYSADARAQLAPLPADFDWRNVAGHSYVAPIRNQLNCGSCYAFAAAAAAETTFNVANGLYDDRGADFSEAFIAFNMSSVYPHDILGCDGGSADMFDMQGVVDYGVPDESVFPYAPPPPDDVSPYWNAPRTQMAQWYRLPVNDMETAARAMMTYGALSDAVQTTAGFNHYTGGVFHDGYSAPTSNVIEQFSVADHAIALVGWHSDPATGESCWILRNSWGASFGEEGYWRIDTRSAGAGLFLSHFRYGPWQGDDVNLVNATSLIAPATTSSLGFPVARGIYAWGGTDSHVANASSILAEVDVAGGFAQAHGMYLWAEGTSSMRNDGTITAAARSSGDMAFAYGMLLQGQRLANTGDLQAEAVSTAGAATAYGMALYGYDDGALENRGTVKATAHGGNGRAYGIYAIRPDTVVNSGNVQAEGEKYAAGLVAVGLDHGSVVNEASGAIRASTDGGTTVAGVAVQRIGEITNRGLIEAEAAGGSGLAYGVLFGSYYGGDGVARLVNSGTIRASASASSPCSIYFRSLRSELTLQTGSVLDGFVYFRREADENTVRLEGTGTEDDHFLNVHTLRMAGTDWRLTGLSEVPDLVFDSGRLTLPDWRNIGHISGNGALAGDNATIQGTIAPGHSVGTTTLQPLGAVTFAPTSRIEVEINGDSPSPQPGVNNDLVDVEGRAVIQGGTVAVQPLGDPVADAPYVFLRTSGGLDVQSPLVIHEDLTFYSALPGYDATDYWFGLSRLPYATFAQTRNQAAAGDYLDAVRLAASDADFQAALAELESLAPADVPAALQAMDGELYGSLAGISVQNTTTFFRLFSERLRPELSFSCPHLAARPARAPEATDGWLVGYGFGGNASGDGNASGLHYSLGGGMVAVQRSMLPGMEVGFVYNGTTTSVGLDSSLQSAEIDSHLFGGYLARVLGDDYYTLAAVAGYDDFAVQRRVEFGTIDRFAHGDHHGWQAGVYAERGRTLRLRSLLVQPYTSLQYLAVCQEDFTEAGAGSLSLDVGDVEQYSLRGRLGLRTVPYRLAYCSRLPRIEFRALWNHEFLDTTAIAPLTLTGGGGQAFASRGLDLGRDYAVLGTGLRWELHPRLLVFANYDLQTNSRQTLHVGSGGLQYLW